jgi:hypothetical protein
LNEPLGRHRSGVPDPLEEELPNFPEAEFEDGQWWLPKKDDGRVFDCRVYMLMGARL